jgi:acyl-CoA thioesterase
VPPERAAPVARAPVSIPMRERYESRVAFGSPWSSGAEAQTGGWIRLREDPGPVDAPLLTAYTDAWPPAVFTRLGPGSVPGGVPTLDLTVHFRAPWPADLDTRDFALVTFRSRLAHEGFVEEDGEIWTRDGRLLAQSRQLAVMG